MASPPASTLDSLRDFFSREDKEKLSASAKSALKLLQLPDLKALEDRFLATDAFLTPWAIFRDSLLLLRPDSLLKPTPSSSPEAANITRLELLWFYTQFDEDTRRYDPRADKKCREYSANRSDYGTIDKREWSPREFEKHLFAWLLQTFQVGKARNSLGFDYLELRNICVAWEAVFIPIVDLVRASYSIKGRHHYGRLATFIESKRPSRLAFPEANVGRSLSSAASLSPFRIISMPKKAVGQDGTTFPQSTREGGFLSKKHYDEAEKELRDVYPQYGGLVERPKFKQKMDEWLTEQRIRAERRKAKGSPGQVMASHSPQKDNHVEKRKRHTAKNGRQSPIKQYADTIRRSLSFRNSLKFQKDPPKSPLHGVTRQLNFPDYPSTTDINHQNDAPSSILQPSNRPETQRQSSEQRVYSDIRYSNPFDLDAPQKTFPTQSSHHGDAVASLRERRMANISAHAHTKPVPGNGFPTMRDEVLAIRAKKSARDIRCPSYEGSGYIDEVTLRNLNAVRSQSVKNPEPTRPSSPRSRIPAPIQPVPYSGRLRTASKDKQPEASEQAAARQTMWPSISPPKTVAWPSFDDDDDVPPPVSQKSPERRYKVRREVAPDQAHELGTDVTDAMSRIVSKENIRAALGGISRESSTEDLTLPALPDRGVDNTNRSYTPDGNKLVTYNKHFFPRKNEKKARPFGEWAAETGSRNASWDEEKYRD